MASAEPSTTSIPLYGCLLQTKRPGAERPAWRDFDRVEPPNYGFSGLPCSGLPCSALLLECGALSRGALECCAGPRSARGFPCGSPEPCVLDREASGSGRTSLA